MNNNNYSPSQIADEAINALIVADRLVRVEESRPLTTREQAEQAIAVIKVIAFAPPLFGLALECLFRNH